MSSSGNQKPICTICYEDLQPFAEDLQCFSICGHVFHNICLQQWVEYCPAGKKLACPVCKQSSSHKQLIRLYFQFSGDPTQQNPTLKPSSEEATEALVDVARVLEGKLSSLKSACQSHQNHIKELTEELLFWKESAKMEGTRAEGIKKEKESIQGILQSKLEELLQKSALCQKLEERNLAFAKELAELKLASSLDIREEEMVKLVSIGDGANHENALNALTRVLATRNKSYKDLMVQCNLLGRAEIRAQKKLDKAEEKIKKLKAQLHELLKAVEVKENEKLRGLRTMSGTENNKDEDVNNKGVVGRNHINPSTMRQNGTLSTQFSLNSKAKETVKDAVDKKFTLSDEEVLELPLSRNLPSSSLLENVQVLTDHVEPLGNQKCWKDHFLKTENLLVEDDIEHLPSFSIRKETHTREAGVYPGESCFPKHFGPADTLKSSGKWCRKTQKPCNYLLSTNNNNSLISVGADGRGGKIKVLKSAQRSSQDFEMQAFPRKKKPTTRQGFQPQIEHFFEKNEWS